MTVQELIQELEKIVDKNKKVIYYCPIPEYNILHLEVVEVYPSILPLTLEQVIQLC